MIAAGALGRSSAAAAAGWGSYTVSGTTFTFDLTNSGTSALQYFTLVGPPGSVFVGGATAGESTAPCSPGQPDGLPNEIECGPLSTAGLAPAAQVLFVGSMQTTAACGQPFELEVTAAGATAAAAVGEIGPAAACTVSPPPSAPCGAARASLGAAQARLAGLGRAVAALGLTWSRAGAAASEAEDALRGAGTAAAGTSTGLKQARSAAVAVAAGARALLATAELDEQALSRETNAALAANTANTAALAACPAGSGVSAAGPSCGLERAALAASAADAGIIGRARHRFGRPALELLPGRLRGAAALLSVGGRRPSPGAAVRERAKAASGLAQLAQLAAEGLQRFDAFLTATDAPEAEQAARSALARCLSDGR